jgi:HK97 family phage major capsid protein
MAEQKDKGYFVDLAQKFLAQTTVYDKASEAKFRSYLRLAELAGLEGAAPKKHGPVYSSSEERKQFLMFLRTGESRDMGAGAGAYLGSAGSSLVPVGFETAVIEAQKWVDALISPDLISYIKTPRGSAHALPLDDDRGNAAHVVTENQPTGVVDDPLMGALTLGQCPSLRSALFASMEFLQDVGIDLDGWLVGRFGVRFGRTFGQQLAAVLAANSPVTATAQGATASQQTGISGSVGSGDLWALVSTLEPSYFLKSSWAMSYTAFCEVMSLRSASTGQQIFPALTDSSGYPLLLGRRVAISPSLPNTKIILGDLKRLIARQAGNLVISVSRERKPEFGQVYISAVLRLQAAAAIDTRTSPVDAPFVCLSTAGLLATAAEAERSSHPAKPEGGQHHEAEKHGHHRTSRS